MINRNIQALGRSLLQVEDVLCRKRLKTFNRIISTVCYTSTEMIVIGRQKLNNSMVKYCCVIDRS